MTRVRDLLVTVLAACVLVPAAVAAPSTSQAASGGVAQENTRAARAARSRTRYQDRWIQLITEYTREVMSAQEDERPEWFRHPAPLHLDLPIQGKGGKVSTLPLLVLPVPIPQESKSRNTCDSSEESSEEEDDDPPPRRRKPSGRRPVDDRHTQIDVRAGASGSRAPGSIPYHPQNNRPVEQSNGQPTAFNNKPSAAYPNIQQPAFLNVQPSVYSEAQNDVFSNTQRVPYSNVQPAEYASVQPIVAVSSQELVELYRKQAPSAPELPPAVIPSSPPPAHPAQPPQSSAASPTRPRFDRSLVIQAELTVHRSDYTEPYTAWYDASTGATRMNFHGGATSTYHMIMPDGLSQKVELLVDRSEGGATRRCGVTSPQRPPRTPRAHPALPDIQLFSYAGPVETDGIVAERWTHEARGEAGAARGERLTTRHELVLTRTNDDQAVPVRYSVHVDSSVLGPDSDSYEHRYLQVTPLADADHLHMHIKIDSECESRELLDENNAAHAARLAPLAEFLIPQRDTRYDQIFKSFTEEFSREYVDAREEAVRKTLVMQHSRFISSCNRQGASFSTAANFLTDRLDVELESLLGVIQDSLEPGERFPHDASSLSRLERGLPDDFDWRPLGAVTHVRYQGSCSSCWAFAVTGAVEGALHVTRGSTRALSEQVLVDCAHKHGAHGCGGTWPSHAYDYVQEFGLPALEEYTPYMEKVLQCRDSEVPPVTHISAHVNVTQNSVPALKVAIKEHAPSVVIIDAKAKSFIFYKKGVLYDDRCGKTGKRLNHAVLAVGWGTSEGEPHFILKNSWSAAWGEAGYIRVQARANTCGVLSLPSYPRLEDKDVNQSDAGKSQRNQ